MQKKIQTALISVFNKDGLEDIVKLLAKNNVQIISTGGTADFIKKLGVPVKLVEEVTDYPALFGGRVKTLHPKIAGGILKMRGDAVHEEEAKKFGIPEIDLVISNLYPFEDTLASGATDEKIVEDIDIGGVTLIREASKSFKDVVIISSINQYKKLKEILERGAESTLEERKKLAGEGFAQTSMYDTAIRGYFQGVSLRYGENPHQSASFIGDLTESFDQLQGKELSYNNLIDTEAAIALVYDFADPAFAIIKHMNACGLAVRPEGQIFEAYKGAYDADPVSAFGGILASNRKIEKNIADLIAEQKLFVEVIIAPDFSEEALAVFEAKKNCRVLKWKNPVLPKMQMRTCFTGILTQDRDMQVETKANLTVATKRAPTEQEDKDLLIASVATKHLKSNAIALVKNGTLISMGCGQTSRIDALRQAIEKAGKFGFDLTGAVLSSEAFFPFPDCVELAGEHGITAVIQPGGSKNDQASIDACDKLNIAMVMTGFRHFKH